MESQSTGQQLISALEEAVDSAEKGEQEYLIKVQRDIDSGNFDIPKFMQKLVNINKSLTQELAQAKQRGDNYLTQLNDMHAKYDKYIIKDRETYIRRLEAALEKIAKQYLGPPHEIAKEALGKDGGGNGIEE
jgi:predicted RNase H-like nuclease (RuvC/YqgF family)